MRAATIVLALVSFVGCVPRSRDRYIVARPRPDPWPTRIVLVERGGGMAVLGLEVERAEGGELVEVTLHDGRHLWVRSSRVRAEDLHTGSLVLVRWRGETALRTGRVVDRTGDALLVELLDQPGGGQLVVSLGDVVGSLERPLRAAPAATAGEAPPPPVDAARQVSWGHAEAWVPAAIASCGAAIRVTYGDGASEDLAPADVAELRVAPGDRVAAFSGTYSYPAIVDSVSGPVARVRFQDGSDVWQETAQLRYVQRPSRASAPTTRPRWLDTLCRATSGRSTPNVLARRWTIRNAGQLAECAGGRAVVVSRDGARSEVDARDVAVLGLQVGDTVRVRWRGSADYLAGVDAVAGTQISLRWEDGSTETTPLDTVQTHLVPARRQDPPRAPPLCGGPPLPQETRIIQEFPPS